MSYPKEIKQNLSQYLGDFQTEINSFNKILILKRYLDYLEELPSLKTILIDKQSEIKNYWLDEKNNKNPFSAFSNSNFLKPDFSFVEDPNNPINLLNKYYNFLKLPVSILEVYKQSNDEMKQNLEEVLIRISANFHLMTQFSAVFVGLNFGVLDYLSKEEFLNPVKKAGIKEYQKIIFNKTKSVLSFQGDKIKIRRKNELPLDHYILESLFEQEDLSEEIYFRDVAEEKLKKLDYNSDQDWKTYNNACVRLQEKIRKGTKNKALD